MRCDDASDSRSNGVCTSVLNLYTSHMSAEPRAHLTADDIAALIKSNQALEGEVEQLKHQLAWFKKQLFGSKSERRVIDSSPQQLSLGESVVAGDVNVTPSKQTVKTHERHPNQFSNITRCNLSTAPRKCQHYHCENYHDYYLRAAGGAYFVSLVHSKRCFCS